MRDDEFRRGVGGFGAGAGPFGRPRGGYGARNRHYDDEVELDHLRLGRPGDAVLTAGGASTTESLAGRRLLGGAHAASDEVL